MKKNLFFLAAATVALASCSNEDVIEVNNGNAIDFRAAMGVSSRGTETDATNIGKFLVTAIDGTNNYFTDVVFSKKEGTTNRYESATEYYWPGTRTLNFYAYSYYTNTEFNEEYLTKNRKDILGEVKITSTEQKITGFSPAAEVADQIDFVSATETTNKLDANKGVELNFAHNLIQTQVLAKTTNIAYTFEIAGVKFGNIVSKGDFDFTNGWTLSTDENDKADYTINYASTKTITLNPKATEAVDLSDTETVGSMMVLPQQLTPGDMTDNKTNITKGAYIAVNLKITTKATGAQVYPYDNATGYAWAYVPVNTNWEKGNRYIYTLDFSKGAGYDDKGDPILGDPIFFTAKVAEWVPAKQADTNMKVEAVNDSNSSNE